MFFKKIINYKGAWEILVTNFQDELNEILAAFGEVVKDSNYYRGKQIYFDILTFEQRLTEKGWAVNEKTFRNETGLDFSLDGIGVIKNHISVKAPSSGYYELNRWLFQQTILAHRQEVSKLPILLCPVEELSTNLTVRSYLSIDECIKHIQPLTPLSNPYPFVILGYSDLAKENSEIIELESDPLVMNTDIIIDRSIEFPAEAFQAGLGIISYFGTYLRSAYPSENAKVKIEQLGGIVRLVIETKEGKREVIEKALHEYQLIVTGQKNPEEITSNQALVLDLKNELRIARVRIESQQDIISLQHGQIQNLFSLIGQGLQNKPSINIDFKPTFSVENSTRINYDIANALSLVDDLKRMISKDSPESIEISDLEASLETIEKEQDPEVVRNSSAMGKLKKFIESIEKGNSQISKIIKTAENGWETFTILAGKYNKIAEWCGLPQVPSIFTRER